MNLRARPLQAVISVILATSAAHAQTPVEGETALETIIVTGTRIQRDPNETAPLPVSVMSGDEIRSSGATDATAALRQIPALIASGTVADSLERGAGGAGQATLNLRQLGSNRTLVLVDGYRHVSGVAGSQAVDVSTIPSALIQSVEVLTGGASAVYGADAVTGVVNYVLRKDFEGLEVDFQPGISSEGDGESYRLDATWGRNFAEGRGNLTVSAGYTDEAEVLLGDRDFTANNGRANNSTTYGHPLRRFQRDDIDPATMPNFATYYSLDSLDENGVPRFPYGFPVPTAARAAELFPGGITAAERALIDRAAAAPLYQIARDPRFAISSGSGLLWRADFLDFNTDLNGNGLADCNESYIGRRAFNFGGACYVTTAGGGVRIFDDGVVATAQNQFGGDGAVERTNETSLTPGSERFYVNLRGTWEFTPAAEAFADVKVAGSDSISRNNYNTFYDSLLIFPENPYVPAALRTEAEDAGGLRVSRDFLDLGPDIQRAERDTFRIVLGLRGALTDNLDYEVVGNHGRTKSDVTQGNSVLYDRLFAAIDVIEGPNGRPICRSDVDPTPHPGSEFFPVIAPGFFSFAPGDGRCRPANILAGEQSVSPEAVAFITTPTRTRDDIEQTVFTASLSGDSGEWFELPAGALRFAAGVEYREEKSETRFDPLELGLLPEGSPAGPAGTFIGDVSDNQSLIFDASTRTFDTEGSFDVKEVFAEVSLPLLAGQPFAEELTLGAAYRYADYSTIGGASTWNVNGVWAPVSDVRLRASYASAIRAPDIFELYSPQQGTTFSPADPCDQNSINALIEAGDPNAQNRLANCRAAGIPEGWEDPLTARISGTSGGNPDLTEEQATTWTVGVVLQPGWTPGLTVSVDYYSIEIEDAIEAVSDQDIVNTCYDLDTFPNQFCALFSRNDDPGSPTYLGLDFLRQRQLNFGRIETAGIDFRIGYQFEWSANYFALGLTGNWVDRLNRYFDPVNSSLVNPGLLELGAPEWAGLLSTSWNRGPFTLNYRMQFIGEQAVASAVQVERIDLEFGPAGWADEYYVHDLSGSYEWGESFTFYGGVNNLTNEEPFLASSAYPVSGLGRYYFLGVKYRM